MKGWMDFTPYRFSATIQVMKKPAGPYAYNRKAGFNYELGDKYEAGIELSGIEVKSVRANQANIDAGYVVIRGGEAFLANSVIPPYQMANTPEGYVPDRLRKLLLSKKELQELGALENGKSLTIVPISMYNKGRKVKIEIAIGHGKKQFDKRETIKKRDSDREIRRSWKNGD
jgi:SsrA-binding protein